MHPLVRFACACCCLLGTLVQVLAAQPQTILSLDHYSTADGLAHNHVVGIAQDAAGFLWLGSRNGLQRFDGLAFERVDLPPSLTPTLGETIVPHGFLAAGHAVLSVGKNLFAHDLASGQTVQIWRSFTPLGDGIHVGSDNEVWFTQEGALQRFDLIAGLTRVAIPDSFAASAVISTSRSNLQVAAHSGSSHYLLALEDGELVTSIALGNFGDVRWIVAAGDTTWLASRSRIGRVIWSRDEVEVIADADELNAISSLVDGGQGRLWASTSHGLIEVTKADSQVRQHMPPPSFHPALISGVMAGRYGEIWMTSLARGLFRVHPDGPLFQHIGPNGSVSLEMTSSFVMALHEASDGAVWIGALGGGISRISPDFRSIENVSGSALQAGSTTNVWSILEVDQREIWFSTDAGLCRADLQGENAHCLDLPFNGPVTRLIQAQNGDVVASAFEGEIHIINPDSKKEKARLRSIPSIVALMQGRGGVLWTGSMSHGLHAIDLETATVTSIDDILGYPSGLRSQAVYDIFEDGTGAIWLATSRGIGRLSPARDVLKVYPVPGDALASIIFSIIPDESGALWLGSGHGLIRFDPTTLSSRLFTLHDGTGISEYNRRAAIRRSDGEMIFGGAEGLTRFDPTRFSSLPQTPPVVVSTLEVAGRQGASRRITDRIEELRLTPNDYSVDIGFVSPLSRQELRTRYRYRLDGMDHDWHEAGAALTARYAHLSPGHYLFRVQSGSDGTWSNHEATLRIVVLPSFWKTWWFKVLVLSVAALFLAAAYRYRIERLLEMQRLRLRIADDLHDDIGSGLSSIALLSDVVKGSARLDPSSESKLELIGSSARQMVGELRDIIWTVDPECDGLQDLVTRMKDTAAAMLPHVRCEFHVNHNLPKRLGMEARRELFFIYKEALHNIARHANAKSVYVSLDVRGDLLELIVQDDGIGFDLTAVQEPTRKGNGIGMKSLRQRVTRLGGTLQVDGESGSGTRLRATARMAQVRDAPRET